jgi:preprotein translocase subunit SecE
MFEKLINYIKETKGELANTKWPTRNQTINFTLLVIGLSLAVAIFLGAFDTLFAYLLRTYILKI